MQIIPPQINPDTQSDAEKQVYEKLFISSIQGMAIHSLDLSKHESKLYSEIDFVVITDRGVLCLEVKGGQVRLNDGEWEYTTRSGISHYREESPFTQARTNKETLMRYVRDIYKKKNGNEITRCVYGYGVVFPDTVFNERGVGIDPALVFDESADNFEEYLKNLYDLWESRLVEKLNLYNHGNGMPRLRSGHIALLAELLVGKTGNHQQTLVDKHFMDVDNKLKEFSAEQYKVFQFGIQNRRLLIQGGAGTGKTLIGIRYTLEKARAGNRVLFLCYNKLLAKWVQKQIKKEKDEDLEIKVINLHDYLLEMTGLEPPDDKKLLPEFYRNRLPEAFFQMSDSIEPFDTLVVDEGQDLLYVNYLLCVDSFVTGGLSHGNWIIFYDENQNLYLRDEFQEGLEEVKSHGPFLGLLKENYRNTKQIDETNEKLTRISSKAFSGLEGEDAEVIEYRDLKEGQERLKLILKALRKKGIPFKDVVILSPHRFENSLLDGNRGLFEGLAPIQPMQGRTGTVVPVPDHAIKYSSIYSFKGLESHVVIIIDMEQDDEFSRRLFYTGISRAKTKLYVLKKKSQEIS